MADSNAYDDAGEFLDTYGMSNHDRFLKWAEKDTVKTFQFASYEEADSFIREYELESGYRYIRKKSRKDQHNDISSLAGHRPIFSDWSQKGPSLKSKCIRVTLNSEVRECQQGKARKKGKKGDDNSPRSLLRKTKKMGCQAKIVLKTVIEFPDYKLPENDTKHQRTLVLNKFKQAFSPEMNRNLWVMVSVQGRHNNHAVGEAADLNQPLDSSLVQYIRDNVKRGVITVDDMLALIHEKNSSSNIRLTNRRYYPTRKTVYNIMYNELNSVSRVQSVQNKETENILPGEVGKRSELHMDETAFHDWMDALQLIEEGTHPSVRIKGTENNYIPTQCFDPLCIDKAPHMHCPFCQKTDSYTDPVILKAHYRVKHVDKGIEFAGLKVLRCCDHCDIVGVIKGEKKFKGAHWHCYKCRNGFNRRDEAIKHYKTHFRNPQTTFQIQISQEVNQPLLQEQEDPTTTIPSDELQIHPALTEAITCMVTADDQTFHQTSNLSLANKLNNEVSMPVAANETVGIGESQSTLTDTHTVMILQEDGSLTTLSEAYQTQEEAADTSSIIEEERDSPEPEQDSQADLQRLVHELQMQKLEQQREIELLKLQVSEKDKQLAHQQNRIQELLNQLSIPLDKGIQHLLEQLASTHKDLLHHQLAELKRTYLSSHNILEENTSPVYIITTNPSDSNSPAVDSINTIALASNSPAVDSIDTPTQASNSPAGDCINTPTRAKANTNEYNSTINVSESVRIQSNKDLDSVGDSAKTVIHIVKGDEGDQNQFEVDLSHAYGESVSEETLQIDSQDVAIESDSSEKGDGSPPKKRRRGK